MKHACFKLIFLEDRYDRKQVFTSPIEFVKLLSYIQKSIYAVFEY